MFLLTILATNVLALSLPPQQSGYLDISGSRDNTQGNMMFYWLCEPQNVTRDHPVLTIWLQGGPGASSLLGLLYENGPYHLDDSSNLISADYSWSQFTSMLYIDNPIGTGYSYTGSGHNYAQSEEDVSRDLAYFMMRFYEKYPYYIDAPLFISGESYGGHYVPYFANFLLTNGYSAKGINLKGISVGDGLTNPCIQVLAQAYAAFDFGLVDLDVRDLVEQAAINASELCLAGDYYTAFQYRTKMESYVAASGINLYDVRIFGDYQQMDDSLAYFLNLNETKNALNVGNASFGTEQGVIPALNNDIMFSVAGVIPNLLDNIPVLLYQGQFDWKDGVSSNSVWIDQLDWHGNNEFHYAPKNVWTVNGVPAGWIKSYQNLTQIIINGAGHMAPMNQPASAYSMIKDFIQEYAY